MRTRFFLAGAVSALLMSGTAVASNSVHESGSHSIGTAVADADLAVYRVTMQLHDGTQFVAAPTLDVKVGEMSTLSLEDGKGQRYSVRLMPMRAGGKVLVASSIDVASGSETYLASPVQMAPLGQASAIELGKDSPSSKPFRLDFTLTAALPSAP